MRASAVIIPFPRRSSRKLPSRRVFAACLELPDASPWPVFAAAALTLLGAAALLFA